MTRRRKTPDLPGGLTAVEEEIAELEDLAGFRRQAGLSDWEQKTLAEGYRRGVLKPSDVSWRPPEKPSPEFIARTVEICRYLSAVCVAEDQGVHWGSCFPCQAARTEWCGGPGEVLK